MNTYKASINILSTVLLSVISINAIAQFVAKETDAQYEARINNILTEKRDVWGEEIMACGGATYEKMQGYLRPLYYSAGRRVGAEQGVHNILYAQESGQRPFFVAIADGSRVAVNLYDNLNDITVKIGDGSEVYGEDLERLDGPELCGGYYPILNTSYRSKQGVIFTQESFASQIDNFRPLVLFVKITAYSQVGCTQKIVIKHGVRQYSERVLTSSGSFADTLFTLNLKLEPKQKQTLYYMWSPTKNFPAGARADGHTYQKAINRWKQYWDEALSSGVQFNVPEPIVMDCQRNLLIQNLVLRHRYSMGNNAYDESLYQPEGCDVATTLAKYGYYNEARNALEVVYGGWMENYANWVKGEQLAHSAEYYHLTKDEDFARKWSTRYKGFFADFEKQIEDDSVGLLTPQALSSDISTKEYYAYQQVVAWRGWRDMMKIMNDLNLYKSDSSQMYLNRFGDSLTVAVSRSQVKLDDGALFVPSILYDKKREVYSPITATVLGGYWNLCMPYAFNSGFFDYNGEQMDGILKFMHNHGGMLLGMLRFNFYGTPIGGFKEGGIPGYYTTGVDNVYLISYLRTLAQRDDAQRLILSFYGRMVHGQTPKTFSSGEGDNIGVYPGIRDRCSFGSWNSANNIVLLEALRYMLITDTYNHDTGNPEHLRFAHATPREWLEHGKSIEFDRAPTIFGEASCRIVSEVDNGKVNVDLVIPTRDPIKGVYLKLRLPNNKKIKSVKINGTPYNKFNSDKEIIDLTGFKGDVKLIVGCK